MIRGDSTMTSSDVTPREERREFLKTTAAAALGTAVLGGVPAVHAGGSDAIRVGLVGCGRKKEGGGRGRGAAMNCLDADPGVHLTAIADLFPDHLDFSREQFDKAGNKYGKRIDLPESRCFSGFDAYKKLIDCKDVDIVILAAPPGFRPMHLAYAVDAGKHVFAEKPVAVDAPGVRSCLDSVEKAKKKGISIVSGLCWRYHTGLREAMARIHRGEIGDIVAMQCTYNVGGLWHEPRQDGWSDTEWQIRNWLYFTWLSGDHNCEQHIHSLDKMAWAMQDEFPVKCHGLGGRQSRIEPEFGHIFDHHAVVYEFANGTRLFSACRQQPKVPYSDVSDRITGTKAHAEIGGDGSVVLRPHGSKEKIRIKSPDNDRGMYVNEHIAWIQSIRDNKPAQDGERMTKSTLMAIMGRMATYTGGLITWEQALNSKEQLFPDKVEFGPRPVPEVARPGVTKFL
jgi:predicted dehydrogenase